MGLTEEDKIWIENQYVELINSAKRVKTEEGRQLIRRAFDLANEAHANMRRHSGEPYFTHPIAVAKIIAQEIGLGAKSISCALLHDVVEDSDYTIGDMERLFGPTIANIIYGLTKISNVLDKDSSLQIENFRKMLMTMSQDLRVIFIKLADRLHNMRTLDAMPEYKRMKIASETMYLYAPLAHRLGLYLIKTELEDLALKYEHPLMYREITQKFANTEEERVKYIDKIIKPIQEILDKENIKCTIRGRLKSIYSIWHKMHTKNIAFDEIYDIFAIRVVFDHPDDFTDDKARKQCRHIMALITDAYNYNPNRTRDWLRQPKPNGYQALHITIMGPEGKWVEIQIRSKKMDDIAERGLAAHWKYKTNENQSNSNLDEVIEKLKISLASVETNEDPFAFLDNFKMNIVISEIYVFTPKGKLIKLPKGSTVIDMAYHIHTDIGNTAIAAKVNYKLQPLNFVLHSGDQVEILTSTKQIPNKEWLNFATTSSAKSKIKNFFKEERLLNIEKGQEIFSNKIKNLQLNLSHKALKDLREKYDTQSKEDFYYKIGTGKIFIDDIEKQLTYNSNNFFGKFWKITTVKPKIEKKLNRRDTLKIQDIDNQKCTFATCCNPIPGDDVAGIINPNNSVIIHKKTCNEYVSFAAKQGNKIISIEWTTYKLLSFLVKIKIEGVDKLGLVYNVTRVISQDADVNIKSLSFSTNNGVFTGEIDLYIHNNQDLTDIISRIKSVEGVEKIKRVS